MPRGSKQLNFTNSVSTTETWRSRLYPLLLDIFYLTIGLIGWLPFVLWLCLGRKRKVGSWAERFGRVPVEPLDEADRIRVWIHAASVGELEAVRPLLLALRARDELDIVVSVMTASGYELAQGRDEIDHLIYFPIDLSRTVRSALRQVSPDLVILVELEVWPNFLLECRRRAVPALVVNGRLSARSFRRLRFVRGLYASILKLVSRFLVQTSEYQRHLSALGVSEDRIAVVGNLKFERPTGPDRKQLRTEFVERWGWSIEDPIWIAGSTRAREEEPLLKVFDQLKREFPDLRLILVPRHVERSAEIMELIQSRARTAVRSSQGTGSPNAEILLVDEVGKLATLYGVADVAFVGGSLVPVGGHNILEPIQAGTPTVHGPHMDNFRRECEAFTDLGLAVCVEDADALLGQLRRDLKDPKAGTERARRALVALNDHRGALEATLCELKPFLTAR